MADIIITNGIVVTMDPHRRVIENGADRHREGPDRRRRVPPTRSPAAHQAPTIIDASNKIVMPGLIDGHAHAGHGLIKTMGGGNSEQWYEACQQGLHGRVDAGVLACGGPSRGARAAALRRHHRGLSAGGGDTICGPTSRSTATPIAKACAKSEPAPSSPSARPGRRIRAPMRASSTERRSNARRLSRSSSKPARP